MTAPAAEPPRRSAQDPPDPMPPCVILAAGRGVRIGGVRPKPMTALLGLTLAERALLSLMRAGVRRFVVVLGHRAAAVRRHYQEVADRRGARVDFVEASDWRLGNGASARAARAAVGEGPFLLTMADHLIAPTMVARLLERPPEADGVALAIDRDRESVLDPEDLTRARLVDGRVVAIGKGIEPWDAADTGLFLCGPALFEGLERAAGAGRHTLSAGVEELARAGRVRAVDVSGAWWLDVDTPEAVRAARARLLDTLGKGAEDGYVASLLNRRISIRLSALLAGTSVTPNQLTVASFAIGLVGAALLAQGVYAAGVVGALLVQIASIVDGCDGEIARLKQMATPRGAWLDTVLDRYSDVALATAVTLGQLGRTPDLVVFIGAVAAISGFLMASYVTKEFALRHGEDYPSDRLSRLKRRDLRLFGIFLGALLGRPFEAMVAVGVLSHACVLGILYRGWRAHPA